MIWLFVTLVLAIVADMHVRTPFIKYALMAPFALTVFLMIVTYLTFFFPVLLLTAFLVVTYVYFKK